MNFCSALVGSTQCFPQSHISVEKQCSLARIKQRGYYRQLFARVSDTLFLIAFSHFLLCVQLLMVVSIVLERNPELEFSDKVDLDGLVKEAFIDFQKDHSHFEGSEKQVG